MCFNRDSSCSLRCFSRRDLKRGIVDCDIFFRGEEVFDFSLAFYIFYYQVFSSFFRRFYLQMNWFVY